MGGLTQSERTKVLEHVAATGTAEGSPAQAGGKYAPTNPKQYTVKLNENLGLSDQPVELKYTPVSRGSSTSLDSTKYSDNTKYEQPIDKYTTPQSIVDADWLSPEYVKYQQDIKSNAEKRLSQLETDLFNLKNNPPQTTTSKSIDKVNFDVYNQKLADLQTEKGNLQTVVTQSTNSIELGNRALDMRANQIAQKEAVQTKQVLKGQQYFYDSSKNLENKFGTEFATKIDKLSREQELKNSNQNFIESTARAGDFKSQNALARLYGKQSYTIHEGPYTRTYLDGDLSKEELQDKIGTFGIDFGKSVFIEDIGNADTIRSISNGDHTDYFVDIKEQLFLGEGVGYEGTRIDKKINRDTYYDNPDEWLRTAKAEGFTIARVKTDTEVKDLNLSDINFSKIGNAEFSISPLDPKMVQARESNRELRVKQKEFLNQVRESGAGFISITSSKGVDVVPIDSAYRAIIRAPEDAKISTLLPVNEKSIGSSKDTWTQLENLQQKRDAPKDVVSQNLLKLEQYHADKNDVLGPAKETVSGVLQEAGTTGTGIWNFVREARSKVFEWSGDIKSSLATQVGTPKLYESETVPSVVTSAPISSAIESKEIGQVLPKTEEKLQRIPEIVEKQGAFKTGGQWLFFAATIIPRRIVPIRVSTVAIPLEGGATKTIYRGLALGYDESKPFAGIANKKLVIGNPVNSLEKLELEKMVSQGRGVESATGTIGKSMNDKEGGNKLLSKILSNEKTIDYLQKKGVPITEEDKELISIGKRMEENTRNLDIVKYREDLGPNPYEHLDATLTKEDIKFIAEQQNKIFFRNPLGAQKGAGAEIPQLNPKTESAKNLARTSDKDFDEKKYNVAVNRAIDESQRLQALTEEKLFLPEAGTTGGKVSIAEPLASIEDLPSAESGMFYRGGSLFNAIKIIREGFDLNLSGKQTTDFLKKQFGSKAKNEAEKIIERGAYLTDNPRTAWIFAESSAASTGGKPAVLQIGFQEGTKILHEKDLPFDVITKARQFADKTVKQNVFNLLKAGATREELFRASNEGWKFYNKFLIRYAKKKGYDAFSHPISKTGVGNKEIFVYDPKKFGTVKLVGKAGTEEKISEYLYPTKNAPEDQVTYAKYVFGTKKDTRVVKLEGTKDQPEAKGYKLGTLRSQIENYLSSTLAYQSKESVNTAKGAWTIGPATPRMKDVPKLYRAMDTAITILQSKGKNQAAKVLTADLARFKTIWEKRGVNFEKYFAEHAQERNSFVPNTKNYGSTVATQGIRSGKIGNRGYASRKQEKNSNQYSKLSVTGSKSKSLLNVKSSIRGSKVSASAGSRGYGSVSKVSSKISKGYSSLSKSMLRYASKGSSAKSSGSSGLSRMFRFSSGSSRSSSGSKGGSTFYGSSSSGSSSGSKYFGGSTSVGRIRTSKNNILRTTMLNKPPVLRFSFSRRRSYPRRTGYTKLMRWAVVNPFNSQFSIYEGPKGRRIVR